MRAVNVSPDTRVEVGRCSRLVDDFDVWWRRLHFLRSLSRREDRQIVVDVVLGLRRWCETTFRAAEYNDSLTELNAEKISVHPAQRELRLMSDVKDKDNLEDMADKDGKRIFQGVDEEKFSQSAHHVCD